MSGPILTHFDASDDTERYFPYYLYSPLVELRFVVLDAKSAGTRFCDFSLKPIILRFFLRLNQGLRLLLSVTRAIIHGSFAHHFLSDKDKNCPENIPNLGSHYQEVSILPSYA